MATEVDICNAALSLLGEAANIVSVKPTDGSEMAGLCGRWLPMATRRIFEEADWSFAQRRVRLSELSGVDASLFGARKCYAWPSDAVRIIDLYAPIKSSSRLTEVPVEGDPGMRFGQVRRDEWRVEYNPSNSARMIVTNVENAVCRYTAYLSSPSQWPQYLIDAITVLLASYLCGALKRSSTASTESLKLLEQYQRAISVAKTIDAAGTRQKIVRVPSSISSRWV